MKTTKTIVLFIGILFFTLCSKNTFATRQVGDRLVFNGDTVWIYSAPLEAYFQKKGERTIGEIDFNSGRWGNTALWRGYVATWQLENDSLFLIRLQSDFIPERSIDFDIKSEFGTNRVFAQWVTDSIISAHGASLHTLSRIYETEKHLTFEQGKLIATKEINFLERDEALLFPGIEFLFDTIRTAILKSIDEVDRANFDSNVSFRLTVAFGLDREISYISFGREPENMTEKIILRNTKKVLGRFPKLMRVNHKWYHPPFFELFFSGHCLRYPDDSEFGCWI